MTYTLSAPAPAAPKVRARTILGKRIELPRGRRYIALRARDAEVHIYSIRQVVGEDEPVRVASFFFRRQAERFCREFAAVGGRW